MKKLGVMDAGIGGISGAYEPRNVDGDRHEIVPVSELRFATPFPDRLTISRRVTTV